MELSKKRKIEIIEYCRDKILSNLYSDNKYSALCMNVAISSPCPSYEADEVEFFCSSKSLIKESLSVLFRYIYLRRDRSSGRGLDSGYILHNCPSNPRSESSFFLFNGSPRTSADFRATCLILAVEALIDVVENRGWGKEFIEKYSVDLYEFHS